MNILKDKVYNPKIDYLLCKSLIRSLPRTYDEMRMRDCYNSKCEPLTNYEIALVKIKEFLYSEDVYTMTNEKWNLLFEVMTNQKIKLSDRLLDTQFDETANELAYIWKQVKIEFEDELAYFAYALVILKNHISRVQEPLIVYHNTILKMVKAFNFDLELSIKYFQRLVMRTNKYNLKHSLEINDTIIEKIILHKEAFKQKFNISEFGLYGSFAVDEENEYSDIDLLVFIDEVSNKWQLKKEIFNYWFPILSIPIDLKVISNSEFDTLAEGIKKVYKEVK